MPIYFPIGQTLKRVFDTLFTKADKVLFNENTVWVSDGAGGLKPADGVTYDSVNKLLQYDDEHAPATEPHHLDWLYPGVFWNPDEFEWFR